MEREYKRGQLEWALWHTASYGKDASPSLSPVFRTRIKRLLELDRSSPIESDLKGVGHAFFRQASEGQGVDAQYTPTDAFCLAIGLELLDAGFKQAEIVFLMRHIRRQLASAYVDILKSPPEPRTVMLAEDRPGCPTYLEKGIKYADCRIFAVIEKVEMKELFPASTSGKAKNRPLIFEPKFIRGLEALKSELDTMPNYYRKALILEIAQIGVLVHRHLNEAPGTRRGPK
jgi:hypothetical protein